MKRLLLIILCCSNFPLLQAADQSAPTEIANINDPEKLLEISRESIDNKSDYQTAIPYLLKALSLCDESKPENQKITLEIHNLMGMAYINPPIQQITLPDEMKNQLKNKLLAIQNSQSKICVYAQATLHVASDNPTESIKYYERLLELAEPNSQYATVSHNNLGHFYIVLKNYMEAEKHLRTGIALNPERAHTFDSLGTALRLQGKHEEAIKCYKTALEKNTKVPSRSNLALCYFALGKTSKSLKWIDEAVEFNPHSCEANYYKATIYASIALKSAHIAVANRPSLSPTGTIISQEEMNALVALLEQVPTLI